MALIQITSVASSGGGGGIAITGWAVDQHVQAVNFVSGDIVINLSQTPLSANAVTLDYDGQVKYVGSQWSLSGNQITILFDDPYVTDYDQPPVFHINYPY